MYQDTSLEREGAPTRQEAEHDAYLDEEDVTPEMVQRFREAISDDPWAADLRNNPDRNDEVELH